MTTESYLHFLPAGLQHFSSCTFNALNWTMEIFSLGCTWISFSAPNVSHKSKCGNEIMEVMRCDSIHCGRGKMNTLRINKVPQRANNNLIISSIYKGYCRRISSFMLLLELLPKFEDFTGALLLSSFIRSRHSPISPAFICSQFF